MSDKLLSLKASSLYPHLPIEEIQDAETFSENYSVDDLVSETDIAYAESLNDEADLLNPVMASGHRMNDIDAYSTTNNPVARDIISSRFRELGPASPTDTTGLSDDEISELAIDRNMTNAQRYEETVHISQVIDDIRNSSDIDTSDIQTGTSDIASSDTSN